MLLFLNISGGELLVVILLVFLVFGPQKLPEIARMLGKGINTMKRATEDIKNEITRETNSLKKDVMDAVDLDSNLESKDKKEDKA